ncbi:MAG: hypothetical protein AAFO15_00720 [Pseudomonadota bacterium]
MQRVITYIALGILCLLCVVFAYDQYQCYLDKRDLEFTQKYINGDLDNSNEHALSVLSKAQELFDNKNYKDSFDLLYNDKSTDLFVKNIKIILMTSIFLEDNNICDKAIILDLVQEMEYTNTRAILLNLLQGDKINSDNTFLHVLLDNKENIYVVK